MKVLLEHAPHVEHRIEVASAHESLATGFPVGERFHSAPVLRLTDAKLVELGHAARADGRWRIYAFGDRVDVRDPESRLARFCDDFVNAPGSPLWRHTPG